MWFSLAQLVRSHECESFQLAALIVRVQVRPGAECAKITYSMKV